MGDRRCVAVPAYDEILCRAGHRQQAGVVCLMTARAAQYDIARIVSAAVGAMNHMMELEAARRPASIHPATSAVAAPDEAGDARWDVLVRTLRRGAVDRPDVLRVAVRAIDDRGVDCDLGASAFLPALLAAAADGERDLELRAAGGLAGRCALERSTAK